MPNIKEISKLAGVSTATVSNVLNNSPKVSPETKEKVLQVIKQTRYKPNNIAKSLKIKKTHTLGIICEDITVFNAPEIINGIDEYAESFGYHILLDNVRLCKRIGNQFGNISKCGKIIAETAGILLSKQVDGIIYIGTHFRDVTGLIGGVDVPVVYSSCYTSVGTDYAVNYDDERAAYDITKYLIGLGHKKIAVISGLYESTPCQDRFKGYQRALNEYNLIFNPSYIKAGDWERESGYTLGKELIALSQPPTAVFSMNDLMAGGVIDAANEAGLKIPRDLSLVGFDNRECSYYFTPKLTTMSLPLNDMGQKSAEILINLIEDKPLDYENNFLKLECRLMERESAVKIGPGI